MTKFQILTEDASGFWSEVGSLEAHSAKSACEKAYLKNPDGGIRSIVAVPRRSWRPTSIRLEQRAPKVVLGDETKPESVEETGESR